MRRRLLQFLATFTFRRAIWIFPFIVLLTWLAVAQGLKLEYDTSLTSFLPPATTEASMLRNSMGDYRKLEPVMVVLRAREPGHEVDLVLLARELARWLDDQTYFSTPLYKTADTSQYQNLSLLHLAQLIPPEDWDSLGTRLAGLLRANRAKLAAPAAPGLQPVFQEDLVTSSLLQALDERIASSRGPTRMAGREGYFLSPDGRALLMLLYPVLSPEDGNAALNTLRFTQRCTRFLFERHDELRGKVSVDFYGSIISTGQHIAKIAAEIALILRFAIPLVFLLFLLVFRKVESLFFIVLPPAIGLVWTLGAARILFGEVTGVTLMFLMIICAIGLEYTIQLYYRFTLELYQIHHYYRALSRAYLETGRGLFASALLMALLFATLFVTSLGGMEPGGSWTTVFTQAGGFGRLGLVAGLGILCNLVACLLALPLMAAVKHALARGRIKPVRMFRFRLKRLYMPAIINPRATLLVMLLVGVILGSRRLAFAPDFAAISPFFYRPAAAAQPSPAQPGEGGAGGEEFPRPGRPIIAVVSGHTLEEALQQNDRLEANLRGAMTDFNLFAYDSLRWSLPALETQRAALARLRELKLEPLRTALARTARELKLSPALLDPLFNTLRTAQRAARQPSFIIFGPEQPDDFILNVQRHVTRQNGRNYIATVIYPNAQGFSRAIIPVLQRRLAVGLEHLALVGDPIVERELGLLIKINLAVLMLTSFFSLVLALGLHFRSPRRALIALAPIVFTMLALSGTMALSGLQVHFFTIMALPLVLCLAMDHAIQFTQYYYDRQPCSVRRVMQAMGRVTVLSGGTIGLCFGATALTSYPGLRDFGSTLLDGLLAIAIGILMLLPALLQLFAKRQGVWQALLSENVEPVVGN